MAAVMVNENHARSVGSQETEVTTRRVARGVNWRWPVVGFLIIAMGVAFYVLDPRRASTSSAMGGYEEFVLQQYTTHVDQLRERIVGQNIPELLRAVVTEALFGIELGPWVTPVMSVVLLVLGLAVTRERPLWKALEITRRDLVVQGFHRAAQKVIEVIRHISLDRRRGGLRSITSCRGLGVVAR